MSGRERALRLALGSGAGVIAIVLFLAIASLWLGMLRRPVGVDYLAFYAGGRLARGDPAAIYDLDRVRALEASVLGERELVEDVLPFAYPPFVALALVVLAAPPFAASYAAAGLLNLACLGVLLLAVRRRLRLDAGVWRWFVLCTALSLPVWFTVLQGQVSIAALLLVTLLVTDLRDGRLRRAGTWLALLTFKPQLVPVLACVVAARRRWRALASGALLAASLWAPSLMWLGARGTAAYVGLVGRVGDAADALGVHPDRMFGLRSLWLALAPSAAIPAWTWWLAAGSVLAVTSFVHHRARDDASADADRWAWSAAVVAVLLVTPHVNLHDLALLVLPTALVLAQSPSPPSLRTLAAACGLALAPMLVVVVPARVAGPAVGAVLLGVWAAFIVLALRTTHAHRAATPA